MKLPELERRGIHNVVVFDAFSSPEKELERDTRTGLLRLKNGIWR